MVVSSIKTEQMYLGQITNVKESHRQTALQEPPTLPHNGNEHMHTHHLQILKRKIPQCKANLKGVKFVF